MKENYTFPAVLDFSEEGVINLSFPDLPEAFTFVAILTEYVACSWEKIKPKELLLPSIRNCVCNSRHKHDAEYHGK